MRLQVLSALKWTAIGRLTAQLLSLASTLLVIRILSPADYGIFALCMAPVTFVSALVIVAPTALIIQRTELTAEDQQRVAGFLVVLAAIAFVPLALSIPLLAWSYEDSRIYGLGALLALFSFWPHVIASLLQSSLERHLRFKQVSLIEFAAGMAAMVVTVSMALTGWGVWALAFGSATGSTLQFVLLFWLDGRSFRPKLDLGKLLRQDRAYSIHLTLGTLMTQGFAAAETFVLGHGLGQAGLGVWRTSLELVNIPYAKIMPIVNRVGFPAYARVGDDPAAIRHYVGFSLRMLGMVFVPVYWGIASVGDFIVPTVMGSQWNAGIPLIIIFGLYLPFKLLQFCLVLPHQGLGHAAFVNRAMFIISASSLLGLLGGISFGLIGATIGTVLVGAVGLIWATETARRPLGISWGDILSNLSSSLFAGAVMCIAVRAAVAWLGPEWSGVPALAVLMPLGAVAYCASFLLIDRNRTLNIVLPLIRDIAR